MNPCITFSNNLCHNWKIKIFPSESYVVIHRVTHLKELFMFTDQNIIPEYLALKDLSSFLVVLLQSVNIWL